ncbi:putative Disease resistance protein RPP13 [Corchorus capsularis]|uniref:Putative Disease resistance protein RPP13 n=1 Tax=Corchorus capsularis TaxID=210143 RepID=A0A1R3JGX3_COCAP|nr:putative Disease resistance protein RPP13 [Corchorus capsularis]
MYQLPKLFRNGRVHRLAIVGNGSNCKVTEELESHDRNCKNLRSLVLYGVKEQELKYLLEHFRLLRVLDLVGIYDNTSDIVDKVSKKSSFRTKEETSLYFCWLEMEDLIHLRYLSFQDFQLKKGILELPASIKNFRYLQTLDLRAEVPRINIRFVKWRMLQAKVPPIKIPFVKWKMQQLRHLYLPYRYDIVGSGKLQLANLRNLQTLVNLRIGTSELQDLLELRDKIRKLVLIFGEEEEHLNEYPFSELAVETIDPIASGCCPKLYKLRIEMKIGELPSYRKFSNSITELILACCRLGEDPMPTLEKLPNLEILHLEWFAFIGREMACTRKGFSKLKSLILKQLKHLEEWKVEEDAMSCLCHLEIIDCFALKNIPIQLRFIATLKELKIENRNMPQEFIDGIRPREQILTRPMILHSM